MAEPLTTAWATSLGLRAPIVCAPMGGVAGGRLAAAVSAAGALGMIGMGSAGSSTLLERELSRFRDAGGGGMPWGIGMVSWGVDRDPEMLASAIAAGPTVISVGFGDWQEDPVPGWIERVHDAGIHAITQVATLDEAVAAAEAGLDAIVVRGKEAGGHGAPLRPLSELFAEAIEVLEIPVLAAGAIHTADTVAELIGAGAAGVWVGTAFSAATEALTTDRAREVLFAATGADTVVSRVWDVALGLPWPARFPERMLRTEFIDRWQGREEELARDTLAQEEFRRAVAAEDYTIVPIDAGEGVGELTEKHAAADVIRSIFGPYNQFL